MLLSGCEVTIRQGGKEKKREETYQHWIPAEVICAPFRHATLMTPPPT